MEGGLYLKVAMLIILEYECYEEPTDGPSIGLGGELSRAQRMNNFLTAGTLT